MGQGSRRSSAQWFRLRIPTGFFPRVGWCCSHLSLDDLEGHFQVQPHGCFQEASAPHFVSLFTVADPRARSQEHQRENDTESTCSHNLICKVTYHYFCHFLLARVKLQSLSTINKEDCALHGVTGDHLRTWLPPHPSLK